MHGAPSVYLAGPITGTNYKGATTWREYTKNKLRMAGIVCYSPMRAKEYLKDVKEFTSDGDVYKDFSVLSTNRGITTRDRWDATRHDVVLVNVLGAEKASIGTVMEIAWADLKRIPIVMIIEDKGNPHDHGMIMESVSFRVSTQPAAIELIKALLLP